jgi:excisionase family DNA binding protein
MSESKDTLNIEEAADMLLISTNKLAEMARAGTVPGAQLGRRWIFGRRLLLDWLEEETARQMHGRRQPKDISRQAVRNSPPDLSRFA